MLRLDLIQMLRIQALARYMVGAMVALAWFGCGETVDEPEPAQLLEVNPPDGSVLLEGGTVSLTFDIDPGAVTVNGFLVEGDGPNRTVVIPADGALSIEWDNGGAAAVAYEAFLGEQEPPVLQAVAPDVDGRDDIDPFYLRDGIALTFDREVTVGALELLAGGRAMTWIPTSAGTVVTLVPDPNDPVVHATEYALVGTVVDASGNVTAIEITFTTQLAE